MVKPKHFLWLLAAAFALASCSGDGEGVQGRSGNANANSTVLAPEAGRLEFPKTRDDGRSIVVVHSTDGYGINYAVEWDCDKRAQRWTCYQMYASNSVTNWNRNKWDGAYWDGRYWSGDPFQEDPELPEGCRTTLADYQQKTIASGVYSVNDWRRKENRPAVEGGDRVMITCNVAPIDSAKITGETSESNPNG